LLRKTACIALSPAAKKSLEIDVQNSNIYEHREYFIIINTKLQLEGLI